MKKKLLILFTFLVINQVKAQDFEYGKITQEEFALKSTAIDNNANALVLREFGFSRVEFSEASLFIEFIHHVRIKILNKEGLDQGNITIPLHVNKKNNLENIILTTRPFSKDEDDELIELKATTINIVNGKAVRTELDVKSMVKEKQGKLVLLLKFAMPNVQEGSIIEYQYQLKSPGIHSFRTWAFQSDIPKLYSEYIANIPAIYNYNISLQGDLKFYSKKAEAIDKCWRFGQHTMDCSKMSYVMKDIPAFVNDKSNQVAGNFKSAIHFNLTDYHTMVGQPKKVNRTWEDIDKDLNDDKDFGGQIKRQHVFKGILPKMIEGSTDELSKAKSIYAYINENIKHNGLVGLYSESDIKTALDNHSGSTGDINLALIAALSAANLNVEPFVLSTRDHGKINESFPDINSLNYVVAILNINDRSYLLDASVPSLPFGSLSSITINGQGRAVSPNKNSYWVDLGPK